MLYSAVVVKIGRKSIFQAEGAARSHGQWERSVIATSFLCDFCAPLCVLCVKGGAGPGRYVGGAAVERMGRYLFLAWVLRRRHAEQGAEIAEIRLGSYRIVCWPARRCVDRCGSWQSNRGRPASNAIGAKDFVVSLMLIQCGSFQDQIRKGISGGISNSWRRSHRQAAFLVFLPAAARTRIVAPDLLPPRQHLGRKTVRCQR